MAKRGGQQKTSTQSRGRSTSRSASRPEKPEKPKLSAADRLTWLLSGEEALEKRLRRSGKAGSEWVQHPDRSARKAAKRAVENGRGKLSRQWSKENPGQSLQGPQCTCGEVQDPKLPEDEIAHEEWCDLMSPAAQQHQRRRLHPKAQW